MAAFLELIYGNIINIPITFKEQLFVYFANKIHKNANVFLLMDMTNLFVMNIFSTVE